MGNLVGITKVNFLKIFPRINLAKKLLKTKTTRPWSELPCDLLEIIANPLALLDLLSFRSVCKDWRLGTARASAICALQKEPWFLLYGENSKCYLYDAKATKSYTMVIPELDGVTCVASKDGWLLLHHNRSLFFFCPFSRAKIVLPQLPPLELINHVGVFTTAPTSPDCVVGFVNYGDRKEFEMYTLKRGSTDWVHHICHYPIKDKIICAKFSSTDGTFYFIHHEKMALKLVLKDVPKDDVWTAVQIVPPREGIPKMPFCNTYEHDPVQNLLGLEKGDLVSTCGTSVVRSGTSYDDYINNEDLKVEEEKKSCNENVNAEEEKEICYKKGVWVHPRFIQLQTNQSWSL